MRQAIPPHADYDLDYFTASPASAPMSIEGMYDSVVSAAACLVELEPCLEKYDGFVVACFSAHPLCHVLREKTTAPVMSILSAPLLLASTLGGKVSILTTSPRWVPLLEHDVQSLGLSSLCHRIASSGLRVLELESLPREQVLETLGRIAREDLVERDGSDVILFLANEDLLPVEEKKRTWDHMSFVAFWVADCFNLNTFTIASSMVTSALTWWQAFICVIIGYCLVGPLLVLNARPGAVHNIPFPAVNRTTFGLFGSLWPVINRAGMACIWWGVQAWLGGECVYVVLCAIWPSTPQIRNIMSPASETTSAVVLGFCIYWILSLTTIWVPIHQLRWLFYVKAIIGPIVGLALFGWSLGRVSGNMGPVFSAPAKASGSKLAWKMIAAISSTFNNMFTLIVNSPDFASRAKRPADGTHVTRAGVAIIGLGFVYVQLLMNVAANSISAGCDLTALFPGYINIRRGGYMAAIVGICMNPWRLFTSDSTFTTYLGAYGVLLSCIAGPMIADYWVVRRGHYRISDLYSLSKSGWYWYTWGVNWRAYVAYLSGFALNAPGFNHTINENIPVTEGMVRVYQLSWITGTGVSALVYILCCYLSPPPGMSRYFEEVDKSEFHHEFIGDPVKPSLQGGDEERFPVDDKPVIDEAWGFHGYIDSRR
ncbi:hypothetical protein MNAN1_003140 [Malassezia nana]|uniref:Uracil permease n=1 Tax=Malassezia nana TaxID=180528 RepID=A0AAF0J3P8_9BASI|nr:hypothetical protein MNAN1_003140 [Malassezia nana]